ncbi:tripartite tricarboxylate transporter TctB family protein [Thalassospira sp.]|uniref:tripartite tricarboxylate transporter TctB family protein n=1 Tax=Thalassospira sp. TaxID=1912094 RepID=UPI003AA9932E
MKNPAGSRILQADIIAGLVIVACSVWLFTETRDMPPMSALLPVVMLCAMALMGIILIGRTFLKPDLRSDRAVFVAPRRFFLVVFAIGAYALGVATLGFYTSTTLMVPSVAWCFGYRKPFGLALATVIFVGGIALIFLVLMNQDLPTEFFAS